MLRDASDDEQTNESMRASALNVLEAHAVLEPPINIYQILRDEEIPVDFLPFKSKILEGIYMKNITGPSIAINAKRHAVKQRFTAAHELKHHRHDSLGNGTMCSDSQKSGIETRANRFAAEILMPPQLIYNIYGELQDQELLTVTRLASIFHVSYEAMVYRLKTLGLNSEGQTDNLLLHASRKNDKQQSDAHQTSERVARLRTTATIATFIQINGIANCTHCRSLILNGRWRVCHSCGTLI